MRSTTYNGYLLALFGVIILSPDSLLIRLTGSDSWAISVWRGVLSGVMILLYNQWLDRRSLFVQLQPAGWWTLVCTLLNAVANVGFVYGISHANVTDVLVIIAFTPLLSALLSALFLGEQVLSRTWLAALVCGIGLAILFSHSVGGSRPDGLLAAVICAVFLAGQFVIIRAQPEANLTPAIGFGNVAAGLACLLFAGSLALNQDQTIAMLIMTLIVGPIPFVLFALSLRHITAAETSLIMLLETVLGSLWVWLWLAEQPSLPTALSGILILTTLTIYGILTLRDHSEVTA